MKHWYENCSISDMREISLDDFEAFDEYCCVQEPDDPEIVNRKLFDQVFVALLKDRANFLLLKSANRAAKNLDEDAFLETILEGFYFERDEAHWMLKFNRGPLILDQFVVDVFGRKLLPIEDFGEFPWEDLRKRHLLEIDQKARTEEVARFQGEIEKWSDKRLEEYWVKNKDDPDLEEELVAVREARRVRAGIK